MSNEVVLCLFRADAQDAQELRASKEGGAEVVEVRGGLCEGCPRRVGRVLSELLGAGAKRTGRRFGPLCGLRRLLLLARREFVLCRERLEPSLIQVRLTKSRSQAPGLGDH